MVDADATNSKTPPHSSLNATVGKRPALSPKPSPPLLGSYRLINLDGNVCLKAVMAVQYMITVNKVSAVTFSALKVSLSAVHSCGWDVTLVSSPTLLTTGSLLTVIF